LIFTSISALFLITDDGFKYDLPEVRPLNMISLDVVKKVRAAIRSISSSPIPFNWWTELSFCKDFRVLLRTGSRFSVHTVVENVNQKLEAMENVNAYVETIDENGNIEVELSKNY
jgi:hypothetical protein